MSRIDLVVVEVRLEVFDGDRHAQVLLPHIRQRGNIRADRNFRCPQLVKTMGGRFDRRIWIASGACAPVRGRKADPASAILKPGRPGRIESLRGQGVTVQNHVNDTADG
ncbi:MAG: hypothetical protein MZV64_19740 [Ignavibacteriales bacterium]|nr:hypothetical protein [Ignavibacteriales bacterium]